MWPPAWAGRWGRRNPGLTLCGWAWRGGGSCRRPSCGCRSWSYRPGNSSQYFLKILRGIPDFRKLEQFCLQFVLIFRDGKRRELGEIQRRRLIIKRRTDTSFSLKEKKALEELLHQEWMNEKKYTARLYLFFLRSGMGGIFYIPITQAKREGEMYLKEMRLLRAHAPFPLSRIIEVRNANSNILPAGDRSARLAGRRRSSWRRWRWCGRQGRTGCWSAEIIYDMKETVCSPSIFE